MTARRLSKLQRQILHQMWTQYERTQGGISTGHLDLVRVLGRDKSQHLLDNLRQKGLPLGLSIRADQSEFRQNIQPRTSRVLLAMSVTACAP